MPHLKFQAYYHLGFISKMIFLKNFVIYFFLLLKIAQSQYTLESVKNIIDKGQAAALTYQRDSNALKYKPTDTTIKDIDCYDFVIIGGGTSGSVLASRLSEEKNFTVLVLEAGDFLEENSILQIPKYSFTGWLSDYNWGFKSVPQNKSCLGVKNNRCEYPRGRGYGGTTLINGLIYDRGSPPIFDYYAEFVKDRSWSFKNVLKYFKKSEKFHWTNKKAPVDLEYHGKDGLLDIQQKVPDMPLNDIYLDANRELGLPITDYNGPRRIGGTIIQIYARHGRRLDIGTAFVKPFLNRTNLKALTFSYVTKIEFNNKKEAESVIFTQNGSYYRVKANKEVIVSGGAVSSPQILMLSGIGPKAHLEKHGIKVIQDLEVGTRFLDQPGTKSFMFSTTYPAPSQNLTQQILEFLNGTGYLTATFNCQGNGFYRFAIKTKDISDVEIMCDLSVPSNIEVIQNNWKNETYKELWGNATVAVSFSIRNTNPKSVGTIRLNSSDPFEYPLIDPNYLNDEKNEDIELMYQALLFVFKLTETKAFQKINLKFVSEPLTACKQHQYKSKDYWYCFLRQISLTAAHPVGTCMMGTKKTVGAVVDSQLKVFGIDKLRVVDASVFPITNGGHVSIPCVMISEKIADIIKQEYAPRPKKCLNPHKRH